MSTKYKFRNTTKTVNEAKESFTSSIDEVNRNKQPLVLTENGKPAAVLIDIDSYSKLTANYEVIEDILEGLKDSVSGRTYTTDDLKKYFKDNDKMD